jgi:hypothetical protein
MTTKPGAFDVEAILAAAGIERPTPAQRDRMRRALALYARSICPRTANARDRWRYRATRLRDQHAPHMDWGAVEVDEDPTSA